MDTVYTASWAAGLFDGEGCVNLGWQKKNEQGGIHYRLVVEMNDRRTMLLFAKIVGVGKVKRTGKGTYRWQVVSRQAVQALKVIFPHLFTKRQDAVRLLCLSLLAGDTSPKAMREKRQLIERNKK